MDAVSATHGVVDRPQSRPYGDIKKGYTFFSDGDVMFAKITPCMQNGKHFIAGNLLDGIGFASTEFHVLRPGDPLLAEWVHFYLRQPSILKEATYHFTGTVGQQRVPDSFLKELSIPLPPVAEQKRIVGVLNRKMAAVEKARAAALERVEAVRALPAAWLREVFSFGGEGLPRGWQQVKLGDICKVVTGTTPKKSESKYYGGETPWIKPSDLDKDVYVSSSDEYLTKEGTLQARLLPAGSVLVSCIGNIGKVAIADCSLCTNQQVNSLVPSNKIISLFLYFVVKSMQPKIQSMAPSSLVPIINKYTFSKISIPVPPLTEQKRIAATLNKKITTMKEIRASAESELEAVTALPAALLREAFSGTL